MKCIVYKVYKPILVWSSALLLFLLAACGGNTAPNYTQEGVEVSIFASLGRSPSADEQAISSQGIPVDPTTGETGVDTAELEVYSGETRLFFREGRVVDKAEGERVTLTPDDSEVSLFLPEGSYRFALAAFDDQDNVLARGQVEQQVGADSRVSIPLTSLLGSASFRVPESATANEVFDAFLEVSPPNRPDLRVPLGDFTVSYEVAEPSVALEGSSNLGVRVAAACDVVEVTAKVDNELSDEVSASASVPVNDEACEDAGGGNETSVGTDLVPPFVSIKSPEANSTLSKDFTLQGDVNDQQSGVDKVEVYEGTVKLGEADIDAESMMWSFDASLEEGSYTLIAVAFDQAGNTSRKEVSVAVEEGAGDGSNGGDNAQTCTNPVEIPDEALQTGIRDELGLAEDAVITCEDLANLSEFSYDVGDSFRPTIRSLEGLQYAVNLKIFRLANNSLTPEAFTPLQGLTSLEILSFSVDGADSSALSFLKTLINLKTLVVEPSSVPVDTEDYIGPTIDLSPLQNLTNLTSLRLLYFSLDDLGPLRDLTKLTDLLLANSSVSDLGPLENLINLEFLYLGNNDIGELDALSKLTKLSELWLAENTISDLTGLQNLTSLVELNLVANNISDLEPLQDLSQLTELSLDSNNIRDLSELQNLPSLTSLSLSGNKIEDVSPLQNLPNLDSLNLSYNSVSDLSAFRNFPKLVGLALARNGISDIKPLQDLTNLNLLNLSENEIDDIEPLVNNQGLTEGDEINIAFNPLDVCPGSEDRADIDTLSERGVFVDYDNPFYACNP